MSKLILVQTLVCPVQGFWDGGKKQVFEWRIDRVYPNGKSRVGSWQANHFFEVATGKTNKQTLGNAKRHLRKTTTVATKSFEYIEEE